MNKYDVMRLNNQEVSWNVIREILDTKDNGCPCYVVFLSKVYKQVGTWHKANALIYEYDTLEKLAKVMVDVNE